MPSGRCWPSRWSPVTVARRSPGPARPSTRSCGPRSRSTSWPACACARWSPARSSTSPPTRRRSYYIAQANAPLDDGQHFTEERVMVRYRDEFRVQPAEDVDYMDVSPKQIVSVATAMIPFLEHDDANRALMGSNMMRQSVPLLQPEAPVVGTGVEYRAALRLASRWSWPQAAGTVVGVTSCRDHGRARRGRRARHLRPEEVPALEPGHLHQPAPDRRRRRPRGQGPGAGRLLEHRPGRDGAGPEHPGRLHALGGRQLRGRHRHQRAAGARGPVHVDPHREARDRGPRHEARPGGDHPRHPERRRGEPPQPGRGRDHLRGRRGHARRHPGRQDHAQGRDRADRGGAPAAGDLRREGARGEGLLAAPAARRARHRGRRPPVQPRVAATSCCPA